MGICAVALAFALSDTPNEGKDISGPQPLSCPWQHALEHPALPAHLHLPLPAFLHLAVADCSINKPTKMPSLEFPCWTFPLNFHGALLHHPAGYTLSARRFFRGHKKENLTLNMHWDVPPTLFETLYGFERDPQQLCHLILSLS
jgi:hypothetical protein